MSSLPAFRQDVTSAALASNVAAGQRNAHALWFGDK